MIWAILGGGLLALLGLVVYLAKSSGKDEAKAEILENKDEAVKEAMDAKRNVLTDADERKRLFNKYTR